VCDILCCCVVMEGCAKLHQCARRVSAYRLEDGKYQILEVATLETPFGTQKSVVIRTKDTQVIACYIPKSAKVPEGNLMGRFLEKKDLESAYPHPCIGVTYSLEIR
jgi:hypothetical protein